MTNASERETLSYRVFFNGSISNGESVARNSRCDVQDGEAIAPRKVPPPRPSAAAASPEEAPKKSPPSRSAPGKAVPTAKTSSGAPDKKSSKSSRNLADGEILDNGFVFLTLFPPS